MLSRGMARLRIASSVSFSQAFSTSGVVEASYLKGAMQERPLLISDLLTHAERIHPTVPVVTRTVEGPITRDTFAGVGTRSKQAGRALQALGMKPGDRVATLAWNTQRHIELYWSISCIGSVLHTLNPRLFVEQLIYIINHAEDRLIFVDLTFVPLLEAIKDKLPTVEAFIVLTDAEHMPDTTLPNVQCYETLLAEHTDVDDFEWPVFPEDSAAALCYTSGTTGNPKGVLFSHRSTVLHTYAECMPDALGLSTRDVCLPVVPLFHANAWGLVYSTFACGTSMVLPGAGMDGKSVWELLDSERVTLAAGVPTVWLMLLQYLKESSNKLPHLERTLIGGSAVPEAMIRQFLDDYDVGVLHAYGSTECSPLVSVCKELPKHADSSIDDRVALQLKQGRPVYGLEMKLVNDEGELVPHDGSSAGRLLVRGNWVIDSYYRAEAPTTDADGWFDTGDISTIDEDGYMTITDRAKDLIKSGGEWLSSIDLENSALSHPEVAEAAVIGVHHPKWDERPLLIVVPVDGTSPTKDSIMEHLVGKVAKWCLPDDVLFVESLPHTATGKLLKTALREEFKDYKLPTI